MKVFDVLMGIAYIAIFQYCLVLLLPNSIWPFHQTIGAEALKMEWSLTGGIACVVMLFCLKLRKSTPERIKYNLLGFYALFLMVVSFPPTVGINNLGLYFSIAIPIIVIPIILLLWGKVLLKDNKNLKSE